MTSRDISGPPGVIQRLLDIKNRRAEAPTKDEIQEAITEALEAGLVVTDIAELTGIPRQQFYQGKYDLTANKLARKTEPPVRGRRPGEAPPPSTT